VPVPVAINLARPWSDFLKEVDAALPRAVQLHCAGGFALVALYDIPRYTGDLDYIDVIPAQAAAEVEAVAGRNSPLAKKHGLLLQNVRGIIEMPENYESRMIELGLGLGHLRLAVVEPYDLLLSKLSRNSPKDQEDAKYLSQRLRLEFATLDDRWRQEMAPWIANRRRHELTLQLWKEYFMK
jgi:hypothetical protein